ncbi:Lipopolysaccharide cholinephosphotransferase LicD1 [uncultured Candidatus Thioglobus sp.]|nr:Lipopolysaccharide cholinephosphotransferase LicD1 [uncultured Candidatus Thioglobus sp.]
MELLNLLKIFDKVCRNNNVEYWLDYGTLLGAVRHKGFIPWDDDIDISVPAIDYHRLISALNSESQTNEDIFLYYHHNTSKNFFEKLASTKMMVRGENHKMFACFIDIFPVRIINKVDKKNDINLANTVEYFTNGGVRSGEKIDKKYRKNTLQNALMEKQKFTQYFHSYLSNCNYRPSKDIATTEVIIFNEETNDYFPYTDIFPLRKVTFEGVNSFMTNNYENYLSIIYENYMTSPPKSKQTPKHANKFYFCNSNQFALETTAASLTEQNQDFYRYSTRKFFRNLVINIGMYKKIKKWLY